jgi:hypothetical protein
VANPGIDRDALRDRRFHRGKLASPNSTASLSSASIQLSRLSNALNGQPSLRRE